MSKYADLLARQQHLAKELNNLHDQAPKDSPWNAEQSKAWNVMANEYDRVSQLAKMAREEVAASAEPQNLDPDKRKEIERSPGRKALNAYLRKGDKGLDAAGLQALEQEGPMRHPQNALLRDTSDQGGIWVPVSVLRDIQIQKRSYGGFSQFSTQLPPGETIGDLDVPVYSDASRRATFVSENTTVAQNNQAARVVRIRNGQARDNMEFSEKLVADTSIDIEGFVMSELWASLARAYEYGYTLGSGVEMPRGIMLDVATGVTAAALGGSVTAVGKWEDLVELEHSVRQPYRGDGKFMMHDDTLKTIRLLKDGQNRPLWLPDYQRGLTQAIPDLLLGRQIVQNDWMAAAAANAKSIVFGDLRAYFTRQILAVRIRRFDDSAYATRGMVGFQIDGYTSGALADSGCRVTNNAQTGGHTTHAVKCYQNAAT